MLVGSFGQRIDQLDESVVSPGVPKVGPRDRALFHTVMEQRRRYCVGVRVFPHLCGDAPDMVDERQARLVAVVTVRSLCEQIGFARSDHPSPPNARNVPRPGDKC